MQIILMNKDAINILCTQVRTSLAVLVSCPDYFLPVDMKKMQSGNETIAVRPLVIRVGTAKLLILVLNESGYKATIRWFTSSHPSSTICLMLFFTNVEPGWRQQTKHSEHASVTMHQL